LGKRNGGRDRELYYNESKSKGWTERRAKESEGQKNGFQNEMSFSSRGLFSEGRE
jgi:hypothetical protein